MSYTVRTETEADYARVAALLSLGYPEPVDERQVREWHAPPEQTDRHAVAEAAEGRVVGYAHTLRDPCDPPGAFWLHVAVDPAERRQGIGAALHADALAFALARGATQLRGEVREANAADGMPFAQTCGFRVERHIFESTLDLSGFDETRFSGHIEALEQAGVRFFSMADLGNAEEAQRRLHALNEHLGLDVPGQHREHGRTFDAFQREVFQTAWYRPEGQIVAVTGDDEWIGLSAAGYFAETSSAYNMMTGVVPAYRGRGVALALKLLVIRAAQHWGAAYTRTNNDSENAPMLAVNRKLGYRPEPGYYRMLRELEKRE